MQHSSYLEAKVLAAPPQRLHLLLVEGAIRFGRQANDALSRGDFAAADVPLLRVIDIIGELLAGVRKNKSELNKKVSELYWYLFRRVSEAKINADSAALADVLRLLDYERQTWQMVCDRLNGGAAAVPPPVSTTFGSNVACSTKSGLSIEA
jgi:flagellar protein FliS